MATESKVVPTVKGDIRYLTVKTTDNYEFDILVKVLDIRVSPTIGVPDKIEVVPIAGDNTCLYTTMDKLHLLRAF